MSVPALRRESQLHGIIPHARTLAAGDLAYFRSSWRRQSFASGVHQMSFNPSGGPTLRVVIASIERLHSLKRTITAVRSGLRATHEIIIVGEHDDALAQWMASN